MNIQHNGQTLEYLENRDAESILQGMRKAITEIQREGNVIFEVRIDGVDVTGREEAHIYDNAGAISAIELFSLSADEWIRQFTENTTEYLTKVHLATQSISNLFYGEVQSESFDLLAQLLEGIQFVMQSVEMIGNHYERQQPDASIVPSIHDFNARMADQLAQLEQSMLAEDYVQAADIIQYEIGDLIQGLHQELKTGDIV